MTRPDNLKGTVSGAQLDKDDQSGAQRVAVVHYLPATSNPAWYVPSESLCNFGWYHR